MPEVLITAVVGALCCFFGIRNMMGDISSLHSYHRNNVKTEDVKPFGKLVGIGTFIIGISVILMSVFTMIAGLTQIEAMVFVGMGLMFAGMIVGIIITFYAMKKYNGGIFG